MKTPAVSSETVHMSCVAIGGRAVLIGGRSGSGKSDLALRLIDRGARLVSDDYTIVRRLDGQPVASAPEAIAGRIEVRGIGLLEFPPERDVPIALLVDLDLGSERLPEGAGLRRVAGVDIPVLGLAGLEPSAPIKVEAALNLFGLAKSPP
jgi:serine kinase of HPr protein (carbohydrate metabolism regulator)